MANCELSRILSRCLSLKKDSIRQRGREGCRKTKSRTPRDDWKALPASMVAPEERAADNRGRERDGSGISQSKSFQVNVSLRVFGRLENLEGQRCKEQGKLLRTVISYRRTYSTSRWSSASSNPFSAAPSSSSLSLTNMLTRGRLLARKKQGKEASAILSSFSFCSFLSVLFFQSAIRGHYRTQLVFPLYALPDKFHERVLPLPVLLIDAKGIAKLQRRGNVVKCMVNV